MRQRKHPQIPPLSTDLLLRILSPGWLGLVVMDHLLVVPMLALTTTLNVSRIDRQRLSWHQHRDLSTPKPDMVIEVSLAMSYLDGFCLDSGSD